MQGCTEEIKVGIMDEIMTHISEVSWKPTPVGMPSLSSELSQQRDNTKDESKWF